MSQSLKSFREILDQRSQVRAKISSDSRSQSQSRLRITAGKIMETMHSIRSQNRKLIWRGFWGGGKFLPFTQNWIYNPGRWILVIPIRVRMKPWGWTEEKPEVRQVCRFVKSQKGELADRGRVRGHAEGHKSG